MSLIPVIMTAPPVTASESARHVPRLAAHATLLRVGIAVGVFVGALAVRWPYLLDIPRMTDETGEGWWALRIARGEMLPLTGKPDYIGVVSAYTWAALMRVFGPSFLAGRGMVAVLGALLCALTAWLAWGMARRGIGNSRAASATAAAVAAIVAGSLTAAAFPLTLITSHVPWANSSSALYCTAALGITWAAVASRRPPWLAAAGFAWALALQTHPLVITLLPGVLVWLLLQPEVRGWLRTPWPRLGVIAFILGYGNMIVALGQSGGNAISHAAAPQHRFDLADPPELIGRVAAVGLLIGRGLSGSFAPLDGSAAPFVSVWTLVFGVAALAALGWMAARRMTSILPLTFLSGALLMGAASSTFTIGREHTAVFDLRYLSPLFPLLYIAVGLASSWLWTGAGPRVGGRTAAHLALSLIIGLMVVVPLLGLASYYRTSQEQGLTNAPMVQMAAAAKAAAAAGNMVILDKSAADYKLSGGGDTYAALDYLMAVDGVDYSGIKIDKIRHFLAFSDAPMFVILGPETYAQLVGEFSLTPTVYAAPGFAAYTAPAAKKP